MFGHKEKDTVQVKEKEKKLSPKDLMIQKLDALESGKDILFKLGGIYVKPFISVTRNAEYPGKGKKFIAFQEGAGPDGKPVGKSSKFFDTNSAKDIASWVIEREGHIYEG
ncbi:MAG: hypothetical protein JW846_09215 [Dehalococcoidia bacterium]|nr:hypothetical protein [Dehalococcoidia bacterium]